MLSAGFAEERDLVQHRMQIPRENAVDGEENVSAYVMCYIMYGLLNLLVISRVVIIRNINILSMLNFCKCCSIFEILWSWFLNVTFSAETQKQEGSDGGNYHKKQILQGVKYFFFIRAKVVYLSFIFVTSFLHSNISRLKRLEIRKKMNTWWKSWTRTLHPWFTLRPCYLWLSQTRWKLWRL